MTVASSGAGSTAAKVLLTNGVPDNSDANNGVLCVDISTTPPTLYVATGGAFVAVAGGATGTNATSIAGVPVDTTTPTDNQDLRFKASTGKWTPQT